MPKISIVIPVYGTEKYIEQFLDSIRSQTFHDFEAIFVDDGGKDNCPYILDMFAKEDERYKVIHQQNKGVSVARNTGISYAEGEYLYIIDSDDWLESTALEDMWNEADKNHADVIYGDYISEYSNHSSICNTFAKDFFSTNDETLRLLQFAVNSNGYMVNLDGPDFNEIYFLGGAPWRCMIKASVVKENDLRFDPYVKGLGDDILFTLHLYEYINSVSYISKVLYHYRIVDESYSHGYKENYLETINRIFEKQEEFLNKHHKDYFLWQSYYMRVLIYLQQGMKLYFQNDKNPKSERELFYEYKTLMKSEPFFSMRKNLPIKYIGGKRMRLSALLLYFKMYGMFWISQKWG